jgi:hypothetical protein
MPRVSTPRHENQVPSAMCPSHVARIRWPSAVPQHPTGASGPTVRAQRDFGARAASRNIITAYSSPPAYFATNGQSRAPGRAAGPGATIPPARPADAHRFRDPPFPTASELIEYT